MYSLNRATIIGNITRDPELRYTPNGQAVTSFSVASNRRWKPQNSTEWQEATEYHDVVAWGKTAEFITTYLKKGNKIYVDGRLQTRGWETPDGVKQRRTEIILENFVPLTPKGEGAASMADMPAQVAPGEAAQVGPNDAPDAPDAPDVPAAPPSTDAGTKKPAEDEINLEDIPF